MPKLRFFTPNQTAEMLRVHPNDVRHGWIPRGWLTPTTNQLIPEAQIREIMRGEIERLFTPGEVARLFRTSFDAANDWMTQGDLEAILLPDGQPRVRESILRIALHQPRGPLGSDPLLTTAEIGHIYIVKSEAVINWFKRGDLPGFRTPSRTPGRPSLGDWRAHRSDVIIALGEEVDLSSEPLTTIPQAARHLGVTSLTVRRMVDDRRLDITRTPYQRGRGHPRVWSRSVWALAEQRRRDR